MDIISEKWIENPRTIHTCSFCKRSIIGGYSRVYARFESEYRSDRPHDLKLCEGCHTPEVKRATPPVDKPDGYDYIRQYYGVPVKVGQRIEVAGEKGTVVIPSGLEHYVHFLADGSKKPEVAHPTYQTVYYAEDGETILADYRAKKEAVTA